MACLSPVRAWETTRCAPPSPLILSERRNAIQNAPASMSGVKAPALVLEPDKYAVVPAVEHCW